MRDLCISHVVKFPNNATCFAHKLEERTGDQNTSNRRIDRRLGRCVVLDTCYSQYEILGGTDSCNENVHGLLVRMRARFIIAYSRDTSVPST